MKSAGLTCLLVLLLGACASLPEAPEPTAPSGRTPKPTTVARIRPAPKAVKPAPIPTRAITVKTDCAFRDETGYNGAMKLSCVRQVVQNGDQVIG